MSSRQLCFICLGSDPDSADHVVARSLFAPPYPDNLLTLPAHHACHNKLDEDYVRVILGAHSETPSASSLWAGKITRSVTRSRSMQDTVAKMLRPSVSIWTPQGTAQTQPVLRIDADRFWPVMDKMVRGLYAHHYGQLLPKETRFIWRINEDLVGKTLECFEAFTPGLALGDVFECRYGAAHDDNTEKSGWFCRFYETTVLHCITEQSRADIVPYATHGAAVP